MKHCLTTFFVAFSFYINTAKAVTKTWDGSSSSSWTTNANWTPSGVPAAGDDIVINGSYANAPILNTNQTYRTLTLSGGALNLNGFTMTLSTSATLTGGTLTNGSLSTILYSNITNTTFGTATQNVILNLTSAATAASVCSGGNTFVGNITVNNQSARNWTFANTTGDSYSRSAIFNVTSTGKIQVSYNGTNTAANGIQINSSNTGGVSFGEGGGVTNITSGALTTAGYTAGNLVLRNISQTQNVANGTFITNNAFQFSNCIFNGDFNVTAKQNSFIDGCTFNGTNSFQMGPLVGATLNLSGNPSAFSQTSGSTTFNYLSGVLSQWIGGNTFGNTILNVTGYGSLGGSGFIYLSRTGAAGDNFNGTLAVNLVDGGGVSLGTTVGTTTLNEDLSISWSGSFFVSGIYKGGFGTAVLSGSTGTTVLSTGKKINASGNAGAYYFRNFTQSGNASNSTFNCLSFESVNSVFGGDVDILASTRINSETSVFSGNCFFTAPSYYAAPFSSLTMANNTFGSSGTSVLITRTDDATSSNNTFYGGNTFNGDITLHNQKSGTVIMANTSADDFNGAATFINEMNGTGIFPAYNGENTFASDISTVGSNMGITFGAGNGRVVIDGNAFQLLEGDQIFPPLFERIRMNTTGSLNLNVDAYINLAATFDNGVIVSSAANLLWFNDDAIASNMSDNSYTDGPVRKLGNDSFTFPVGDAGYYAPISISAPSTVSDHFTGEYFYSDPNVSYSDLALSTGIDHISDVEYWILNRTNGSSNVNVTLSWNTRSGGVTDPTNLLVARWNGSAWSNHGNGGTTGTLAAGTLISSSPVNSFSPFTLASSIPRLNNPLPVELTTFTAEKDNDCNTQLHWTTMSERDNDRFEIQKSINAADWEFVASIDGKGTTNAVSEYKYTDASPTTSKIIYYRLKQVDFNGNYKFSEIVSINSCRSAKNFSLWPNPSVDELYISGASSNATFSIIDELGRKIILSGKNVNDTTTQLHLNGIKSGIYFIVISNDSTVETLSLIISNK